MLTAEDGVVGSGNHTMEISEVQKVAALARLSLNEQDLADCQQHLGRILEYVQLLEEVDVSETDPLPHPVPRKNVFRDDVVQPSLTQEQALHNACCTDGKFFLVPRILDEK